jgi:predicted  nucleic acid-binding Zn-ribbon protein
MIKYENILKKITLAASVSLMAMASAACASPNASAYNGFQDTDAEPVAEEKQKVKEKRGIKIISNGKQVVDLNEEGVFIVDGDGDGKTRIVIDGNGDGVKIKNGFAFEVKDGKKIILNGQEVDQNSRVFINVAKANERALREVARELKRVEKKLKKADNEVEREALESARDSLKEAIEGMKERRENIVEFRADVFEWEQDRKEAIKEAIKELKSNEKELGRARVIMLEELAEAREEIAEAFEDMDFDFDFDFDFDDMDIHIIDESDLADIEKVRVRAIKQARDNLDSLEERHLKQLKRSEERLKKQQDRLARELDRSKAREEALRKEREALEKKIAEQEIAKEDAEDNQK